MILLMASTGMRIGALHSLRIGDLTKLMNFGNQNSQIFKVQVYARTKDRYYTFCTPECAKTIDEYLRYRIRCGEQLKDESPLFRKRFNKQDPFTINVPKFLSAGGVTRSFDEIIKRSGVNTSECMRSHAFRKGFKSLEEQSGMKSINVEILLGHDIGLGNNYYRPNEADLLEDYMSHAAEALTIDPNYRLKARVQQLESEQSQEISELRQEMNDLKQWLSCVGEGESKSNKLQQQRKTIKHLEHEVINQMQDEYYEDEANTRV
jgi:integrase